MGKRFLVQIEYDFFTEKYPEFKNMSDVEKRDFVKTKLDELADYLRRDNSIVFLLSEKIKVYELPEDSEISGIYTSDPEVEKTNCSQLAARG